MRSSASAPGAAILAALCALCHVAGLAALSLLGLGGLRWQLGLWIAAGLCWLAGLWSWRRAEAPGWRSWLFIGVLALGMRLPVLLLPIGVVHSNDVYRYFWDGAVRQAGLDPYAGSPESPLYDAVRLAQPELYAGINHRYLPTIYPPVAQAAFAVAVKVAPAGRLRLDAERGGALWRWRLVCGLGELALLLLLSALLGQAGVERRWLALPALCPLPVIEVWLNGHVDWLGLLLLAAALSYWPRRLPVRLALARARRSAVSGALLILSVLVKPLGAALLPGLISQRVRRVLVLAMVGGALIAALAAWWPYREAGLHVMPSLGEYGRRWRSNDGAYALIYRAAEAVVSWRFQPPRYLPWEPWQSPRLAHFVTGRERDTVFPDELASFFARSFVAILLLASCAAALRLRLSAARCGLLLLSAYALLTPVLHPWYLLWPLLLAPLWLEAAWPMLTLAALAPLAYLPLPDEWAGLGHHEAIWWRLVEHGGSWAVVFTLLWRFYRRRRAASVRRDIAAGAQAG